MASQPSGNVELLPQHNLARYCRPRTVSGGILSPDAFFLRTGEQFLSTNWLEHFHDMDRQVQLSGVRASLAGKGFGLRAGGTFAVVNVGVASQLVQKVQLRFLLLGQENDLSHAGIFGYTPSDIDVAGDLRNQSGNYIRRLNSIHSYAFEVLAR